MPNKKVTIIGGGLAGSEAAWQLARAGIDCTLYEMKPQRFSPAHKSPGLAELVCSNSLRSDQLGSAIGLLKEELRRAGSIIMEAADMTRVPAGRAHAVDRRLFSEYITQKIEASPRIKVIRKELCQIPEDSFIIIATGPLSSEGIINALKEIIGGDFLSFYDAIAPIISADSIDYSIVFRQSRYSPSGKGDYLNCPLTKEEYERFINEAKANAPFEDFPYLALALKFKKLGKNVKIWSNDSKFREKSEKLVSFVSTKELSLELGVY